MTHSAEREIVLAQINLDGCPPGQVLQTMEDRSEVTRQHFAGWATPLAPWGCYNQDSGAHVMEDDGRMVLEIAPQKGNWDRAIVTEQADIRDCTIIAQIKPIDEGGWPSADRADCTEALVGIVFRAHTSRHYYQFGIEGRRRAVLYRRTDDEWALLAGEAIQLPDGYVTLQVALDGDGIRCQCSELGVDFLCTDTSIPEGKVGVRTIGRARLTSLCVTQTPAQQARDSQRKQARETAIESLGANIPDPVPIRTLDLDALGGKPTFGDFAEPDRFDMLVAGETLRAMTVDGEALWEVPHSIRQMIFSEATGPNGRLVYGFIGRRAVETRLNVAGTTSDWAVAEEMCVIEGKTGEVVARAIVPDMEEPVRFTDFSLTTANLTGNGKTDVILREWRRDAGDGGFNVWAYDRNLNLLWHNRVKTPYGHNSAIQFFDVNEDGRDEVLAGGTLLSADGDTLWEHDLAHEMSQINGAGHYDSVALGAFADDAEVDPVAFLFGGSAGVYVLDGTTGRTRMIHRIGHAQTHVKCRSVPSDLPGTQIVASCRWGNFGIMTCLAGRGDRLWTLQPDIVPGVTPVEWAGQPLLWVNPSGAAQALYDGYGRKVKVLHELRDLWGDRMRRDVVVGVTRMGTDPRELLHLTVDGRMHVFGPAE